MRNLTVDRWIGFRLEKVKNMVGKIKYIDVANYNLKILRQEPIDG